MSRQELHAKKPNTCFFSNTVLSKLRGKEPSKVYIAFSKTRRNVSTRLLFASGTAAQMSDGILATKECGMQSMYELSDSELDMVAAGQPLIQAGNLINANVQVADVLSHNQVTLTNVLSNNTVQVAAGIAVAVLSGATGAGVLNQLPA
jgi:hypothetical protein